MIIAITDACIFIDLHELQLTSEFFSLPIEVHTTLDVFNELNSVQREVLKAFMSISKLQIHNLLDSDRSAIHESKFPKALSEADKSVLYLAIKINAMVLSSDKTVRKCAKVKCVEYHGVLWILDRLVEFKVVSKVEGINKLENLIRSNVFYQNNPELIDEMHRRKALWA